MTITLQGMHAYPITTMLRDGSLVVFRPLVREDEKTLLDFFIRIPDIERYYLKEDVTSPEVIRSWTTDTDFDRVIPVVAFADGHIVADATLSSAENSMVSLRPSGRLVPSGSSSNSIHQ